MKVRWTDESLRLRITPTELRLLIAGKPLAATLQVPGGAWHVHVDPGDAPLSVHADGAAMVVQLSSEDIARLAEPEREGVYAHAPGLRLMVEKGLPVYTPAPRRGRRAGHRAVCADGGVQAP